jgi:hippurate hydrolase
MRALGLLVAAALVGTTADAADIRREVDSIYPPLQALYRDLHEHPELSTLETETAAKLAGRLEELGFDVTTGVGGTGLVAVLKNGAGPSVALRVEMDALPVVENTGLAFASKVRTKDASGAEVGVMHACGHDAHMAAWIGTAMLMAQDRKAWHGTLVFVGQPAEEVGVGAKAMMADGLLQRFPKPDFALAIHDDARRPAGEIGIGGGPILTNADSLDLTVYGRGGHGARPEATIDPVLIAARIVVTLQSVVAREMNPLDPAVITVGSIHGGTKYNIIPDEVKLQLTVRSFTTPVRMKLLAAIARIAKAEAEAAGAEKLPTIKRTIVAEAMSNDPALAARLQKALVRALGPDQVKDEKPEMVSEDFTEWSLAGVPSVMMRIGAVPKDKYDAAMKNDTPLPSLHSSQFAPDAEPTIKAAITAEVVSLRELMR